MAVIEIRAWFGMHGFATTGLIIDSRKNRSWREHFKVLDIEAHYGEVSESTDLSQVVPPVRNERKYVPMNEAAMTGAK